MKYLLDTNTCVRYINGRAPQIRAKFRTLVDEDIATCTIVQAEMFYGAAKSNTIEASLAKQRTFLDRFVCLDFGTAAASIYGSMRARLEKQGTPIGAHDLLIAAIAIANDLILVTHNTREFSRIEGLKIEDWEIEE
jgi:tRNA(fMet)-specific endonuclease VapC